MFGVPVVLVSDRGAQFSSSIWSGVCASLGILASTLTFFHPQSNGMNKRFHGSIKPALRSCLASLDWFLHLPLVLLGLRTVPKDDPGFSVSEAVYGSHLTVPGEFLGSHKWPPSVYLSKIKQAVAGFAISLPHHVPQSPPCQLQLPCCLRSLCLFQKMPLFLL